MQIDMIYHNIFQASSSKNKFRPICNCYLEVQEAKMMVLRSESLGKLLSLS